MPKKATAPPLALPPRPARLAASRWLYEAVRGEILDGRLRPGQRLPASRDLARQYQLARGTVVVAFEQLQAEGYLVAAVGSGTRVSEVLPEELLHAVRSGPPARGASPGPPPRLTAFG
ncbi:MAG: winged helix-turn-helix domain-containing protein, partial [Thermoanaerobaculia bacterium]|nr:winged helix-turn-helix domain-containing protein [Thermoanaerobaculia bacterium]